MNGPAWGQTFFLDEFDRWVVRDDPSAVWRIAVLEWVQSLLIDPWRYAKPDHELGQSWWYAVIPEASDNERATICSYFVDEDRRYQQCAIIATLRRPI